MSQTDLLNDILSSDPNEPAPKGALMLFRMEMKSEFKSVSQRFDRVDQRMDGLEQRMDKLEHWMELMARQIAIILDRLPAKA